VARKSKTEYQRGYQRKRRDTQRRLMGLLKLDRGCDVCGYDANYAALQWHHRDPADKAGQVSWMLSAAPDVLEAEMAKCDLLCANCHAEREWPTSTKE
jgi:hypothetical protein